MSEGMGRVPFTVCILPFTIRFYCIGLLNRNHGKKFWIGLYFRDLRKKLCRKRRKKLYLRTFNFCRLSTRKRLLLHQAGVQVCAQKISNKQLCPTSLKFEALSVKQKIRCFVQKWITTQCVWVSNLTTKSPHKYPISRQAFAFPVNLSRVQWNYVKST